MSQKEKTIIRRLPIACQTGQSTVWHATIQRLFSQRKVYVYVMKTAKNIASPSLLSLLCLLIPLTLLLTACGHSPSTGSSATPASTKSAATGMLMHTDQQLVSTYKDATNLWHLSRYDTRTGTKTDIYTTAAGQIKEAQVSADGQWVLFLIELSPAMRVDASAKVVRIRVNGQGLQTLFSVSQEKTIGALKWSPDQHSLVFRENMDVYLFDMTTATSRLVVPASEKQGFVPRTWLDATHLYLMPYTSTEEAALKLYLLDIKTTRLQPVLSPPIPGRDFASSIDGTRLFTCHYAFVMPTTRGPSSIEVQPATGGQITTIYQTPTYAITALRVASRSSLLFLIHNTGVGNVESSYNGLWRVNTDGTGLSRLTSEIADERTQFAAYTQYVWSAVSRDGNFYAVKVVHTSSPNTPSSLLIGSRSGGKPVPIASTGSASTLEIVGWTTM
jgi:dipeptidyl aminopeptidase/acylaminoacyl peptidase